jgi:hypothetical protein
MEQQKQTGRESEAVDHQEIRILRGAPSFSAASAFDRDALPSAAFSSKSRSRPRPAGFMPPRNR